MLVGGRTLRSLMGGHAAPEVLVPRLIALHGAGRFSFERLVVPYPFEKINNAVEDALSGRTAKPVLRVADFARRAGRPPRAPGSIQHDNGRTEL